MERPGNLDTTGVNGLEDVCMHTTLTALLCDGQTIPPPEN